MSEADWWLCAYCQSLNNLSARKCYSCHRRKPKDPVRASEYLNYDAVETWDGKVILHSRMAPPPDPLVQAARRPSPIRDPVRRSIAELAPRAPEGRRIVYRDPAGPGGWASGPGQGPVAPPVVSGQPLPQPVATAPPGMAQPPGRALPATGIAQPPGIAAQPPGLAPQQVGIAPPPGMAAQSSGLAPQQAGLAPPPPGIVQPHPGLAPLRGIAQPSPGLAPPPPGIAQPPPGIAPPPPGLAQPPGMVPTATGIAPQPGMAAPPGMAALPGTAAPPGSAPSSARAATSGTPPGAQGMRPPTAARPVASVPIDPTGPAVAAVPITPDPAQPVPMGPAPRVAEPEPEAYGSGGPWSHWQELLDVPAPDGLRLRHAFDGTASSSTVAPATPGESALGRAMKEARDRRAGEPGAAADWPDVDLASNRAEPRGV